MEEKINRLLNFVDIGDRACVVKTGDSYKVEINTDSSANVDLSINGLMHISRQLSLMVYEHFNPDHHKIKPMGFGVPQKTNIKPR